MQILCSECGDSLNVEESNPYNESLQEQTRDVQIRGEYNREVDKHQEEVGSQ